MRQLVFLFTITLNGFYRWACDISNSVWSRMFDHVPNDKWVTYIRPYTSPFWKAIRGELSPYKAVSACYTMDCCGSTSLESKARKFLRSLPQDQVCFNERLVLEYITYRLLSPGFNSTYRPCHFLDKVSYVWSAGIRIVFLHMNTIPVHFSLLVACYLSATIAELSLVRCLRSACLMFCQKGGSDNTTAERIISILTCGNAFGLKFSWYNVFYW